MLTASDSFQVVQTGAYGSPSMRSSSRAYKGNGQTVQSCHCAKVDGDQCPPSLYTKYVCMTSLIDKETARSSLSLLFRFLTKATHVTGSM